MNTRRKNLARAGLILLAGIGLSALIIVAKPKPEPKPPEPEKEHPAQVVAVKLVDTGIGVHSQGTVNPKIAIDVTAQVSGQVIEVAPAFAVGGAFKPGQMLIQIDPRDYQIAAARAASALEDARRQLAIEKGQARQAKREWRDLGDPEANALFLREPQLAAAEAAVKAAEAAVAQAQLDLERTTVSLPFEGRVARTDVNLGQFVPSGKVVARVFSSDVMEVRLPLTAQEMYLLNIKADSDQIQPLDLVLSLAVGGRTYQWQGQVVRTEPGADENTRLFHVIAEVRNAYRFDDREHPPLVPGTFVEATITSNPYQDVAVLPRNALYQQDKVMVLDKDHHLQMVTVEVLQSTEEKLVVKGLQDGDLVLVEPPSFVEMGVRYRPVFDDNRDERP